MAVVISSAVAGAATAPVAAAHFNRIADYGLPANLLSVPLMGAVVMPAAVLTACLTPLGLAWIGLGIMRPAIDWILSVAHFVAGMDGAVTPVVTPPAAALPLLALGGLWLILWRARGRSAGLVPVALCFVLWSQAERPPLLISSSGGLVGLMTDTGRALSKPRGDGFSALSWLENDGDAALQEVAFQRLGDGEKRADHWFDLGGHGIAHLAGRGALDRISDACKTASLVVIAREAPTGQPCPVFDAIKLRQTGSLAVYTEDGKLRLVSASDLAGLRLWSP